MRNLKTILVVAGLAMLALASPAQAQTHPCDVVPTQNITLSGPVKAQFCSAGLDVDGVPTSLVTVKVYVDGNTTPTVTGVPVVVTATPNATGERLYEAAYMTLSKASHTVKVTLSNATTEGPASLPFVFALVDGAPAAATKVRAVK